MMFRAGIVTLFPEMMQAVTEYGVTGRAAKNGYLRLSVFNPRDFTGDKHGTVDDKPYGGGPGMVMKIEPLRDAIKAARNELPAAKVIYLTPQGKKFTQADVATFRQRETLIMVAGRYEGIDERLIVTEVDEEWSIGDYVLSGGELAVMVMVDAITRTIPGVLGDDESAQQDSFSNGLLDYPHYTRPDELDGMKVPEVLISGNHAEINRWRLKQALGRTWQRRPDLIEKYVKDEEHRSLLKEYIDEN